MQTDKWTCRYCGEKIETGNDGSYADPHSREWLSTTYHQRCILPIQDGRWGCRTRRGETTWYPTRAAAADHVARIQYAWSIYGRVEAYLVDREDLVDPQVMPTVIAFSLAAAVGLLLIFAA